MFKYSIFILFAFFLIGCSATKETTESNDEEFSITDELTSNNSGNSTEAMAHFVDGSIAEAKGDFAGAILEYQDALRLDPHAGIYYALAKNYFYINKLSLALQNIKNSISLDSTNISYYTLLSDIYTTAHQPDSAEVVLEKIISIDSSNVQSYYKLARLYEKQKPLQAVEIYNKLTNLIGSDWNVLLRVAELYDNLGEYKKAASAIKELIKIDPSNSAIQELLVNVYEKEKNYDEAINVIDDILELTPDDLTARERKARLFIQQDKWQKAADEYKYILNQPKIPLDVKVRIGASYFNQSLNDSTLLPVAKKLFKTIDKDTLDWQVKMYLGAIALSEKNDSTAIENFKLVTQLASWNVDAWVRLGGLYFDNKKYPEAIKVMNEAIVSFPDNFAVNLILGLSLAQSNKNEEAESYLKKAVDLNPKDVNALSAYGYTLSQLKKDDEAILYLKKALALEPDEVDLLGTLGLIYNAQKKYAECDSVYQRALDLDSASALINNNYAYSLSERGERLKEALIMSKKAIKAEPENSSYLDTMGWIYYKLEDYKKAEEYLKKALNVNEKSPVILEHLGDVVFKIGRKSYAKELWQKAYEIDSSNNNLKQKIEKGEI